MSKLEAIGVGGTLASGKDTVGIFLAEQFGWLHVSTGDLVREEVTRLGLKIERTILQDTADRLRQEKGIGVLGSMAVEAYLNSEVTKNGLVVSGIRTPAEYHEVRKELQPSKLIYLDASISTRFDRLVSRGRLGDEVTLADFQRNEEREMQSQEKHRINHAAVKAIADVILYNDGRIEEFYGQITELVES